MSEYHSVSAPDPFTLRRQPAHYLNNEVYKYAGRTLVNPNLVPGESTAVLVAFGDSFHAASGSANYVPTNASKVQNLSLQNGGVYLAQDPLLGCTDYVDMSFFGHWISRVADQLITAGEFQRIIVMPIAVGGTTSEEWADETLYGYRYAVARARLVAAGYGELPTLLMSSLGTNDVGRGFDQARITAGITAAMAKLRLSFPTQPVFMAQLGKLAGVAHPECRAAITACLASIPNTYLGADYDTIDLSGRQADLNHFNEAGLIAAAAMWTPILQAYLP